MCVAKVRRMMVWSVLGTAAWMLVGCSSPGGSALHPPGDLADLLRAPGRRRLAFSLGEQADRQGRSADAEVLLLWSLGDGSSSSRTRSRAFRHSLSAEEAFRAHTLLAALAMERGDYAGAVSRAQTALRCADTVRTGAPIVDEDARDAALLVLARASVGLADYPGAVAAFSRVARPLDEPDLDGLIVAYRGQGDYSAALARIEERRMRFGYAPGHGSEESLLHEWTGRPDRAVASALIEAEYLRYHHGRTREQTERALDGVHGALDPDDPVSSGAFDLVSAYRAFLDQSWESTSWMALDLVDDIDHPFVTYLLFASRIRNPPVAAEIFHRYADLEPLFAGMQFYYAHLWRGLREAHRRGGLPGYSVLTMRDLLERTILAAPASPEAYEARTELAVLAGLPPEAALDLLLPDEIDQILEAAIRLRDPRRLDPLVKALSMPESPYLWAALLGLQRISTVPAVRDYLSVAAESADQTVAERIQRTIGN